MGAAGEISVLKEAVPVLAGEVVDAARMSTASLREFFAAEVDAARAEGVLLSLHLKATMMKVSDPIMFGHAVTVYYRDVFDRYAERFRELGIDPDNGIGDVYEKIQDLPDAEQKRSRTPSKPSMRAARRSRWWTPARASPTCTSRAT